MNYLAPIPKQFVDHSGIPYSGGTVTVYLHGSTAKATLYASASGNTLSPNPVVLDSNGAWKAYVPAVARYDYVVEDKGGNVVFSFQDVAVPVDSDFDPGVVASEYSPEATYPAGSIVFHDGELYKALTDITTPEDWDSWHWVRTDIADCMPILFECTDPNWPDPELMFEAVKAGRLAGICQLSYNGESKAIFALGDIANRVTPPASSMMEFRHVTAYGDDMVQFVKSAGVWSINLEYNKSSPRATICSNWSSAGTYTTGDLVYRGDKLWRCLVGSPSHVWNSSEWAETTVAAELARKGETMKTFTLIADSGKTYTFTGNNRAAVFTKIGEVVALKALSANVSDTVAVGFKAGDTVKVVAGMVKAGQGPDLQSPAMAAGVTGLSASLQLDIVALANDGTVVNTGYSTVYLKELDWNIWEPKELEVTLPATLPAGATCFGLMYSGAFACDDYNIQDDFVGQTVKPEILIEVNTSSDKLAAVSDGTDVS